MLIFFTFVYWLVCWVTYLFVGFEVSFFLVSFLHFLSPFCFLSTQFNNAPQFVFFVAILVSIVTIIYIDLWNKSKFYWVILTFWNTVSFPLCMCNLQISVVVFLLKKQSNYNHMSIVSNETTVSRYVNFIVVSFNLLWANACLLMCVSSPSKHKGNYLSNMEAAIDNLFWKICS